MKKVRVSLIALAMFGLFYSASSFAAGIDLGMRSILKIYCMSDAAGLAGYCYIEVDGTPGGPAGCQSNVLRWSALTAAGQNVLSVAIAAKAATGQGYFLVEDVCDGNNNHLRRIDYR